MERMINIACAVSFCSKHNAVKQATSNINDNSSTVYIGWFTMSRFL